MERFNEMVQLFDNRDQRTFDDIYGDKMDLFEDTEDVIDPRMEKLFEETYRTCEEKLQESEKVETYEKLFEDTYQSCEKLEEDTQLSDNIDWSAHKDLKEDIPPGGHNFTGDEPKPSGDGIPASHNKPGLSGSDPATVQSGQDYSHNTKFFESVYEKSYI